MFVKKIPLKVRFLTAKTALLRAVRRFDLKRGLSLLLLTVFIFHVSSPTALAFWELQVTQAAAPDFGGMISSAVSSVFGKSGEILEKFDSAAGAAAYQTQVKNNTQFNLVAILVDEEIANNNRSYDGLTTEHNQTVPDSPDQLYRKLTEQTLMGRVERYARDVQGINKVKNPVPFTKTAIIKVKRDQPTQDIAAALEKLYREGDGTLSETNRLTGLVIVGQVPLPVVNKNDNRFVSLFPYTDFDEPYYVFDQASGDFKINTASQNPAADVWHGLIVPPADGEEGNELLAEYFDKNHLFKIGEPGWSDFDKKLFYSDLNKEYQLMGAEGLPSYEQYLKYWEDISYFRFNKTWAKKLLSESPLGKPEGDGVDNDGDGKIDEDPSNGYDDDGDGEPGSPLFGLINRVDDDNDGKIDNDEEGVWGICSPIPALGKTVLQKCQAAGQPYKTGNYYNTKPGSLYKVSDNVNNNPEEDMRVDEGTDEDEGDAFIQVDNDRDGRIDEDTSQDNDADQDGKQDEDDLGDMNGDGCPGECDTDEDNDSVDSDQDGWPDGYERDYGSLMLTPFQIGDLLSAAANGNVKQAFDSMKSTTDKKAWWSFPIITMLIPPLPPMLIPRFLGPFPSGDEWIDEGSPSDDDEDGMVDEDGGADNDKDQDGPKDEDPGNALGTQSDGGDIFENLPDIRTKDIIMNFFKKYNDLFDKFFADINVWTDSTGRYKQTYKDSNNKNVSDLVTFPFLVAAKDEFTRLYLKAVNDAIEKRVDKYVQQLQYDIELVKGSTLSGYVILPDANGVFPPGSKLKFNNINFVNFGYKNNDFFSAIEPWLDALALIPDPTLIEQAKTDFLKSIQKPVDDTTQILINGKPINTIEDISECSLYRGSEGDENSQMVIASTLYDPSANLNAASTPRMPESWNSYPQDALTGTDGNDYHGLLWHWNNGPENFLDEGVFQFLPTAAHTPTIFKWLNDQRILNKSFAGCFSENVKEPTRCFPALATRYIFSLGGTRQVTGIPKNATSHQACFDLKEKNGFDAFALAANIYLKHIAAQQTPEGKASYDPEKPSQAAIYQPPKQIKLLDITNAPPTEMEPALIIPQATIDAAQADPNLGTFSVNLEDVLKKFLGGNRVDDNSDGQIDEAAEANLQFFPIDQNGQPNWNQVGEQLLQKLRINENDPDGKVKPLKFGNNVIPGTKEVYIKVAPLVGKKISSLVYHKDPTIDTIQSQTYELARDANGNLLEDNTLSDQEKKLNGKYQVATKTVPDPNNEGQTITVKKETRSALSIPIDSPRYATFRDSKGNYQEIVYPNSFRAANVTELKQQLADLEQQLSLIEVNPLYADPELPSVNGYLTGILEPALSNDVMNTALDEVSVASESKLADALQWKSFDIDQKHNYALSHYWGSANNPFTPLSESKNGYEVLYLNSTGASDAMSMKFNKDIPPPKEEVKTESVDCTDPQFAKYLACKGQEPPSSGESGSGGSGSAPGAGEGNGESSMPVFLTEWFQKLGEWAKETMSIMAGQGATLACPAGGFTDLPGSGPVDSSAYTPDMVVSVPVDTDGNGIPDQADQTVMLSLQYDKNSKNILAGGTSDQTKVMVQALDDNGVWNKADSNSKVKLTLKTESGTDPVATIIGEDNTQLAGGKAYFLLGAGNNSGTVSLQAELADRPEVRSDVLVLKVTSERIKLMSFRRYTTYKFTEGAEAGYSIFDGNGNAIAETDPKTGYINILDKNKYELRVLAASGKKPLRQAVAGKEDGKIYAILYFVAGGDKAVNIDATSTDYSKDFTSLDGVHLKDLSAGDHLSLQSANEEEIMKGGYLIIDKNTQDNKGRVGYIDKRGNAFTALKMKIKEGPTNGPVIFQIENSNGQPALELYVGSRFEKITELPYEEINEFFAKLPGVLLAGNWLAAKFSTRRAHAQEPTVPVSTTTPTGLIIPDTDKDGLNDLEELSIGTDLNKADTNGNGQSDLQDLTEGNDPRLPDKLLFNDLSKGQEGFNEVVKLLRRGVVVADSNGDIRPNDSITREEFIKLDLGGICVMCDRFSEKVKESVMKVYTRTAFPDTDIGQDYKYCVAEGKNRGIISGYKAYENVGYYVPKANITRAEATKVILETARQQIESFPQFVANENLSGKPWYYNYVLTAQKEGIFPRGKFQLLDDPSSDKFKAYFDQEIINSSSGLPGGLANSQFMIWLNQPISRVEFAIMVSRFSDKYNCLTNDKDGDGLPDNLEKYVYGTNPGDADTDKGGVKDGEEVLRGSNPLDPADDFPKPPQPDANSDDDDDGLTYSRETEDTKTNPLDPDTDKGGVRDGTEVLLGIDPLDTGDDKLFGSGSGLESAGDGAYLSGLEIGPKTIYEVPDISAADAAQINTEETDRVPADGESQLYIRASIYDENGNLRNDDSLSVVKFGFKDKDDGITSSLYPLNVQAKNGVAETTLTTKTTTGLPTVIASIDGKNVPSDEKLLEVYALPPAKAELKAVSPIIPSGGKSTTDLLATFRDKNGNLADSASYTATFGLETDAGGEKPAQLDPKQDEDKALPGIQVTSVTGQYQLKLLSGQAPEGLNVKVSYQDPELVTQEIPNNSTATLLKAGSQIFLPASVEADATVQTRDDLQLIIKSNKPELKADATDNTQVEVRVEDALGNNLSSFKGEANLKLMNPEMGQILDAQKNPLSSLTLPLENGLVKFTVRSSTKAGKMVLLASIPGLSTSSLTLENYAFNPKMIVLESSQMEVKADPAQGYTVRAKIFDGNGNLVKRDNSTSLTFSIDPESAKFGQIISQPAVKVKNGQADVDFQTGTLTGPVRIRAKAKDLLDGYLEVSVVNQLAGRDLRQIKPKFLYADLLGASFGEVTQTDYFGGWFVFSGKVQSAASLITDPKPKMRLLEVLTSGAVKLNDSNSFEIRLVPTGQDNAPVKQVVNDLNKKKELMEVSIVAKPQSQVKLVLDPADLDLTHETVNVLNLVAEDQHYIFENEGEKITLTRDNQLLAEIGRDAKVRLFGPTVDLVTGEGNYPSNINWSLRDMGNELGQVIISTANPVGVKLLEDEPLAGIPGVYLRKLSELPDRSFVQSFSGNSSAAPRGYYYTDDSQPLGKDKAPGMPYLSLESADQEDGIGLKGDNKNVLLFSAGNSAGEANLPYSSDAGVVLGDPTVRLDNRRDPTTLDRLYSATGFTMDMGKMILADNKTVKEVTPIDYDNDGDKDLFVSFEDGRIKLMENVNYGKEFLPRGVLLNFPTGILSQAVLDINDDGWQDLVVATADSCKIGEVCVDAYLNNQGNFVRKNLALEGYSAKNKVFMLRAADMNQDSFTDLVVSDDNGNVKIFYVHKGEINLKGSQVGNLGVKINQTDNLKEEVFVHYDNMQGNQAGSQDDKYFEKITLKGDTAAQDQTLEFKSLADDVVPLGTLGTYSTKKAQDITEPFDVLSLGDQLEYTIKLKNTLNKAVSQLMLADIVPENVELNKDSIKCSDCKKPIRLIDSGMSLRPYLITGSDEATGIDLPANSTRTITYRVTVKQLPKVKIAVGQNLTSSYPVQDGYPDIAASPDGNPTGRMVYYYSISKNNGTGQMTYGTYVTPDPNASATTGYQQPTNPETGKPVGIDLSLFEQKGPDGMPIAVKYLMDYGTFPGITMGDTGGGGGGGGGSTEGDSVSGIPGVGAFYDGAGAALDQAADKLEGALAALTCTGGCIPLPINFAFLAPGAINVMGIPSGFDPGFPIFAAGIPSPVPIWPPSPFQASQYRLYLSPTLTGKIAMANCFGTYLVGFGPVPGNCFTIVLPIDPFAELCKAINKAMQGALGAANSIVSDVSGTIGNVSDGSLADTPTADGKNYTGGFEASSSLGNYGFKVNAKSNIRMPGFPSVLTDWLDNQSSEIINKLTDLPDIYILFPKVWAPFQDAGKVISDLKEGNLRVKDEPVNPSGLRGVLNKINQFPLLSIVPQEVIIKIPSLTPGEIERFINDAKQWVQDEKYELERALAVWKCGPFKEMVDDPNGGGGKVPGYETTDAEGKTVIVYGDRPYAKVCDIFTADMTKLIQSVEKNIEVLEGYKKLPRQLLAWRNMLTKYVSQVICYIDAIVQFFVGNIAKWLDQAYGWVDAVAKLVETIATWKMMFDLIIDYQTSCDKCSSARFTLLELILKLFAFIPSPPIIPFPKLPDIYLDFSQVQMGITILFPDIKFRPEKLVLPKLPRIVLPELPTFQITLPEIPVLPDLSFSLPELPDLPPLIIPALPNLPPPPKIPALPGAIKATISILKKIFKILCLIKKGFIPTNENVLKSTVEHMTERGLDPLLPFDLGLAFQLPNISYDYVDRIVLTVKINLNKALQFTTIYDMVQLVANNLNKVSTTFSETANSLTKGIENAAAASAAAANATMQNNMPEGNAGNNALLNYLPADLQTQLSSDQSLAREFAAFSPQLAESIAGLMTVSKELEAESARYREIIDRDFQDIKLVAGATVINPTDSSVNKSLENLQNFDYDGVMLALGDGFDETKKLANLRQNLFAYARENQKIDEQLLASNDLSKFATLTAKLPGISDLLVKSGYAEGTMMASEKKTYAKVPSMDDLTANSGLPASLQSKPVSKGMFIYNEAQQINEKLISYEDELSLPSTMNFVDVNGDTDKDLVYSFGSNVYLKENYKTTGKIGKFYGGMPKYYDLEELVPAERSVSGLLATFTGNQTLDLTWSAITAADSTGYELIVGPKLGGVAYKGVINDLKASGLSKYVYLNSQESTGGMLTNSVLQAEENAYEFPASQLYEMVAAEVSGEVVFTGPQQKILPGGSERYLLSAGEQIFASQDSVLQVWSDGQEMAKKKMSARELISLPDSFGAQLEIKVESGSVTIITPSSTVENQKLLPGAKIELNTRYESVGDGSALIKLPQEAYTRVDAEQNMQIGVLDDPANPAITLNLPNGFYYAVVRSFDRTGFRSLQTAAVPLSPNICSDRQVPLPVAGPSLRKVAIFKTLTVDTGRSFDTFGKIMSYYIDTDLTYDSNGDGNPTNDRNLGHDINPGVDSDGNGLAYDDLDDPVFTLGPYKDLNPRQVMLNVVDQSNNTGQQQIDIEIYVPKISLDEQSATLQIKQNGEGETVSGSLDPVEDQMPISLLRDRAGVKEALHTLSANANGKYFSNAEGKFSVNDLNLNDTVVIKNEKGEVVAEIDPKTGRVILKNPLYSVEALPAEEPLLPTRVVVKDPQGKIIATLFVVSDANTDVVVDGPEVVYTGPSVLLFKGVHIKDLLGSSTGGSSDFEIKKIPGDAEKFAGGVEILEKSSLKRVAVLDSGGNFYIYDPRIKLALKSASALKDPMIFQVVLQKPDNSTAVIAEFYISFSYKKPITILDPASFQLFVGASSNKGPDFDTDKDGMPDLWEQQYGLNIDNAADADEDSDQDGLSNLEEYLAGTNPLLADSDGDGYPDSFEKVFGTDPNAAATSPFSDVDKNNPYYQSILNFFQRGILKGIPSGNRVKFGFDEPILRSEFAKVILDTFCIVPRPEAKIGPAVFTDIPYQEGVAPPWYYAATKEAYFQGFITGYRGLIDKVSGKTPFAPDATISKAEAVKIILEALEREGLISLDKVPLTEPYYVPYLQIAQNLTTVIKPGKTLKSNYLLTAEEAVNPEADLNRGEFIKLADRVLLAYDCSLIDTDGDGMPDFWEKQHNLDYLDPSDADDDPDKDRLVNLEEYKFGTDPWLADTDKGGIWDGVEVLDRHTNPLDPSDDYLDADGDGLSDQDEINKYKTSPNDADTDKGGVKDGDEVLKNGTNPLNRLDDRDTDGDGLGDQEETDIYKTDPLNPDTDGGGIKDGMEVKRGTDPLNPADDLIDPRKDLGEGVYVIPEPCASCPCPSAIDHTADLIVGDKLIGVISNDNNSEIFSESNLVEIKEIKEYGE